MKLQLGNLVYECRPEGKEIIEVESISKFFINGTGISIIEPIPITEEWLLNFGFTEKLGNWELPNFRFHVNKPMNFDGFIFCEGYSVTTDKIQFVHQLQNLYFALTGEELILKQ